MTNVSLRGLRERRKAKKKIRIKNTYLGIKKKEEGGMMMKNKI